MDHMKNFLSTHQADVMKAIGTHISTTHKTSFTRNPNKSALNDKWTTGADQQFTQYINQLTEGKSQGPLALNVKDLEGTLPPEALYPLVSRFSLEELHLRYAILRHFNSRILDMIKLVDLSQCNQAWSLGAQLSSLRFVIFNKIKMDLWQEVIQKRYICKSMPPH